MFDDHDLWNNLIKPLDTFGYSLKFGISLDIKIIDYAYDCAKDDQ